MKLRTGHTQNAADIHGAIGKILVVDDEPELKSILVESLTERAYDACGVSSGPEALTHLQDGDYDILFSDLMMPEMDGLTLLQRALEIDPNLICIMMTGQGAIQSAVDAMKLGAFDYVLKPFRLQTMMPVLTRAMNTRHLRLENVQLSEAVAVHELSQTIAFTLDPPTVISKLADTALQQSEADEVSVLLPTDDGKELYVAAVRGARRERLLGERIPFDKSIASWVGHELRPVILNGEVRDKRFVSLWPRSEIQSSVSVPMQVANKLIGVLNVNTVNRPRRFTLGQMKALSILAGTAASALESASLHSQILQAEENYRSIFENAIDGVFRATPDGKQFISVNPAMVEMFGFESPKQMIETVTEVPALLGLSQEIQAPVLETIRGARELKNLETKVNRKDGLNFWITTNIRGKFGPNGDLVYLDGMVQDITERKQAQEALAKTEDQLRHSQKMEAVGQLAGGVAHDFNNLLTAITGYSELTLQKLQAEDPLTRNIQEIRKAGERAAALTRQLLAFSRKQVLQPRVLDLNSVILDLQKMLRRLIGENIELNTQLGADLGGTKADPGQIEQVIMNLVVNARDAMPEGGKLLIETGNIDLDEGYAKRHVEVSPGAYVMLAVSDNGFGMSPETQARIFEPFFTTKELGKGTGLGLSTVYGITRQSNGSIWVYSEEGRGTTFKVYLPRVDELAESDDKATSSKEDLNGTETVLVAEDEDMVRGLATEVLAMHGYKVLEAANGGAALLICERHPGPIDLLLSDVIMPEMSGPDLKKRLEQVKPEMKVLYMSGYTDGAIVQQGVLRDNASFIQKPFAPDALARKVRKVLDN
ncbi:MAG TPA: response regulator [Pyrinomonadaceae bacterium]|jgi:PAS domain S-box-containing protein|nr:response regulator [Pyrinomonadaceae bacterium]